MRIDGVTLKVLGESLYLSVVIDRNDGGREEVENRVV